MKNSATRTISRIAHGVLLCLALGGTAAAQEPAAVNARPGPEFGTHAGDGLLLPSDVAVGAEGRVYVVDSGRHRIAGYDATGNPTGHFGKEGKGDGEMQGPVGIATGPDGTIYVADRGNNRVQVFTADGMFRRTLELVEGETPVTPVDVAVGDNGGKLFVTANNSHKVVSASARNGKVDSAWGGDGSEPGQFKYPATLAVNGAGEVLVVDVLNQRVQVFDGDGAAKNAFGALGAKPGTFIRPKGVAVDGSGRIYVSDSYLGVVQVFSPAGEFVGVLSVDGTPARFESPTGLAWSGGRLYVTDMLAGKVLSFDVGGAL